MTVERFDNVVLMHADCMDALPTLDAGSIDMVCADPPYGTTACKWDTVIPLEPLWRELKRLVAARAAVVMTASQPFTSSLVMSNPEWFKYRWVWKKTRPGGFVSAKLKPLKSTEDVCVFSSGNTSPGNDQNMPYFPQGVRPGRPWKRPQKYAGSEGVSYVRPCMKTERQMDGEGYPQEIIEFANPNHEVSHPTEKPVALMDYLIRTYTNEGETVLDFCCGSGTTAVACIKSGRKCIAIEKDAGYFDVSCRRVEAALSEQPLFAGGAA